MDSIQLTNIKNAIIQNDQSFYFDFAISSSKAIIEMTSSSKFQVYESEFDVNFWIRNLKKILNLNIFLRQIDFTKNKFEMHPIEKTNKYKFNNINHLIEDDNFPLFPEYSLHYFDSLYINQDKSIFIRILLINSS